LFSFLDFDFPLDEMESIGLRAESKCDPRQEFAEQAFIRSLHLSGGTPSLWLKIAKWIDGFVLERHSHTHSIHRLSTITDHVTPTDPIGVDDPISPSPYITSALDAYRMLLSHNPQSSTLSSSLRFLDLLVNEGGANAVNEEYADVIPPSAWYPITRQIFCRLSHPNRKVSQIITRLLHSAALVSPESVLYLSTRGTQSSSHLIQSRSRVILQHLRTHNSSLVEESDVLFRELIKMSELWDEQWLLIIQR
jgi:hypothetical protein